MDPIIEVTEEEVIVTRPQPTPNPIVEHFTSEKIQEFIDTWTQEKANRETIATQNIADAQTQIDYYQSLQDAWIVEHPPEE